MTCFYWNLLFIIQSLVDVYEWKSCSQYRCSGTLHLTHMSRAFFIHILHRLCLSAVIRWWPIPSFQSSVIGTDPGPVSCVLWVADCIRTRTIYLRKLSWSNNPPHSTWRRHDATTIIFMLFIRSGHWIWRPGDSSPWLSQEDRLLLYMCRL